MPSMFSRTPAIALALLVAPAIHAQAERALTLQDAVDLALRDNPGLSIQDSGIEAAAADVDAARALRNVRVDLSLQAGGQSTDTNSPFALQEGQSLLASAQVAASRPVWTSGRIPAAIRAAKATLNAAEADREATRQQLILGVISAYADLLQAEETVRIRANNLSLASEQRQAAQDRFDVGEITRTDVSLALAREEGARANLSAAEANAAAARAAFVEIVGVNPIDLAPLPPQPLIPQSAEQAIEYALEYNPQIISAEAQVDAAREQVKSTRAALGPQVNIVGRASAQETWDDRLKDTSVSVLGQASIPLYDGDQIRSQTRGAKARRDQAQYQLDLVRRQVIREITSSWAANLASERAIEASRAQVRAAEAAYDGARQELAVGQRTTLDVLDTEQDLFEAQLGLLQAERDGYITAYRILAAMGALDSGLSLGTVPAQP